MENNVSFVVITKEGDGYVPRRYVDYTVAQHVAKKAGTVVMELPRSLVDRDYRQFGSHDYVVLHYCTQGNVTLHGDEGNVDVNVEIYDYEVWTASRGGQWIYKLGSFDRLWDADDYLFTRAFTEDL